MTDKMEQIEARIKGTVDDTTDSVKRMVDVKYQISEHPWASLGIAVLAGYALGSMGEQEAHAPRHDGSSHGIQPMTSHAAYEQARSYASHQAQSPFGHAPPSPASFSHAPEASLHSTATPGATWSAGAHQNAKPGLLDGLSQQFGDEIEMLKTAAVTSLVSLIRDTIRQNIPSLHQEMERLRVRHSTGTSTSYATKSGYPDDSRYSNPL
jgi:hypothetical protein